MYSVGVCTVMRRQPALHIGSLTHFLTSDASLLSLGTDGTLAESPVMTVRVDLVAVVSDRTILS